jgi:hypothetical protein
LHVLRHYPSYRETFEIGFIKRTNLFTLPGRLNRQISINKINIPVTSQFNGLQGLFPILDFNAIGGNEGEDNLGYIPH